MIVVFVRLYRTSIVCTLESLLGGTISLVRLVEWVVRNHSNLSVKMFMKTVPDFMPKDVVGRLRMRNHNTEIKPFVLELTET
jgi:hypothetical protein